MITSDEHMKAYNEKLEKIRLDQEAKENRRKEIERRLERERNEERLKHEEVIKEEG